MERCFNVAECLLKRARYRKNQVSKETMWKSLHDRLFASTSNDKQLSYEDTLLPKSCCLFDKPLKRFCEENEEVNRLVVNLFPTDTGYSLMLKTSSGCYTETLSLPYEEYDFLEYIDNEEIPPMLVGVLENLGVEIFYSGCVIAEIRDYRIAAGPESYQTNYVLLRPSQQTLLADVNSVVNSTSHVYQWNKDDRLALESCLILSTAEPLCLEPDPTVAVLNNIAHQQRNPFKTTPFKRSVRRHGLLARLRHKERRKRSAPPSLKLFDFLQRKAKKSKESPSGSDIRLPPNVVDLWPKEQVAHDYPSGGIGVMECAKPLSPRSPSLSDDLIEVQQVHLKSDSVNRDVYSRITILQRPSDMQYYGRLQSNKYFQQPSADKGLAVANSRSWFTLGTEHRANLYILQYQELFAEDGRRPAAVAVSRPLQPTTKYQIPLQQQPWQLEQDRALYSVGSINNIPVKHWAKLKSNDNQHRAQSSSHAGQQNPQARQQSAQQPMLVSNNSNNHQVSNTTTPTLNAITLQSGSQSAFMFPMTRAQHQPVAVGQQSVAISGNQTLHTSSSVPAMTRVLGHRLSTESLNILQSSGQDRGTSFGQQQGSQKNAGVQEPAANVIKQGGMTSLVTQGGQKISNVVLPVETSGGVSLQLPLTMTIATQPQQDGTGKLQLSNAGATIVRVPASGVTGSATGNQQLGTTINLLSGSRNAQTNSQQSVLNNIQQIQLGGTFTIPANLAVQLAAQLNQQQGDKTTLAGAQQMTLVTSGTSSPITIISKEQASALNTQQPQQQHRQIGISRSAPQLVQHLEGQKSATITINPRTQMVNLRATPSGHQPVQILQQGNIQQIPVRSQGQQQHILLNTVRSGSNDQTAQQLNIAQLQHFATTTVASGNGGKQQHQQQQARARKRKITPDVSK